MTMTSNEPYYSVFRDRSLLSAAFAGAAITNFSRRAIRNYIKTSKITSYAQNVARGFIPAVTIVPLALATSGCIVPNGSSFEPETISAAQQPYYVVPIAEQLKKANQNPAGFTLASANQQDVVSASFVAMPKINYFAYLNAGAAQQSVNDIADTLKDPQAREDLSDCMGGAFGAPFYKETVQNHPDKALGILNALTGECIVRVNMENEKRVAAPHHHKHRAEIRAERKQIEARKTAELSALEKVFSAVASPKDKVLVLSVSDQMRHANFVGRSSEDIATKILKRALKNPVEIMPTELKVDYSRPVFDAAKATLALPKDTDPTKKTCAHGVHRTYAAGGVVISAADGSLPPFAKNYNEALPHSGFVKIEKGDNAAKLDVSEISRRITELFGDSHHPYAVVFTKKNDPSDAGHILNPGFIGSQTDKTFSDFAQLTESGLQSPGDYSYNVFVYTGLEVNYDTDSLNRLAQNSYKMQPIRHVRYTQNFSHFKASAPSMKG